MVVRQKLLGIFGQAVTAVAERRIIVIVADSRVVADAFDNILRGKSFNLGVGVQLVEISNSQGKISIGKKFNRFGFRQAHQQSRNIFP